MDAPICRVCGEKHWGREPHQFKKTIKPEPELRRPAPNKPKPASDIVKPASNAASNNKQRWDRKAYNKYQRDLMRKRRAKKPKR